MKKGNKIAVIVVLLLVVLFGVGQFFSYSNLNTGSQNQSQNNQPATQVIAYVPPTPSTSTPVEDGSCWTNSIAAPYRTDAWRCMVGNAISDPCFEIPGGKTLSCGADPAGVDTSSAFVLNLMKPLPQPEMPSGTVPTDWAWLVELGDGTICAPFTGTRPFTADGQIAYYSCNSSAPGESLIFGDLNNQSQTWTANVGSLSESTSTFPPVIVASATVPVFAVWQ